MEKLSETRRFPNRPREPTDPWTSAEAQAGPTYSLDPHLQPLGALHYWRNLIGKRGRRGPLLFLRSSFALAIEPGGDRPQSRTRSDAYRLGDHLVHEAGHGDNLAGHHGLVGMSSHGLGVPVHRISPRPFLQFPASVARRFCHEITALQRLTGTRESTVPVNSFPTSSQPWSSSSRRSSP